MLKTGINEFSMRFPHNFDKIDLIKDAAPYDGDIPCIFLDHFLSFYWDGRCALCCADLNGTHILGHIDDGVEELIKRRDRFRQMQVERVDCPPCRECERYGESDKLPRSVEKVD
jgi:hypothetical protein